MTAITVTSCLCSPEGTHYLPAVVKWGLAVPG